MDIYDIVLNFTDVDNFFDFFEWKKEDKFIYIDRILVFKISSRQMREIIDYHIIISEDFLSRIKNMTVTSEGVIEFSCLVTDTNKVLALKFSSDGSLKEMSALLLDEEEIVIEEASCCEENLDYILGSKRCVNYFLTRSEKVIRKYLLEEIESLYKNKEYDEINYLYKEVFVEEVDIKTKYKQLIDGINNNFNDNYKRLYDIVKMT